MNLNAKRKKVIVSGLVVALITAMYVNWYYTKPNVNSNEVIEKTQQETKQANLGDAQYVNATVKNEGFSEYQLKRSQLQDEAKQNYTAVIESKTADEESKAVARNELEELNKKVVLQGEIESLIKSKVGKEVFVMLGDTAEIILEKGALNQDVALQIEDIISRKSEIPSEKITIIEVK